MKFPDASELPEEKAKLYRKAIRVEQLSVAYWISLIILLYFTLGQSQAMKAAWVEDILGLFPPVAFLVASRYRNKPPSARFPFGYHRAITVAYVVSAVALFGLGLFILFDSVERLLMGTHPPIGMVEIFDWQIWLGWLMIAALLYGLFPSLILGRVKQKLAEPLHDKVLFADSKMNQADWLTAAAAILGIVGIGFGIWWADAAAAIVISCDILYDGQKFLRESVGDLMDEAPETVDESEPHPLINEVREHALGAGWVTDAVVRLREQGHLVTGEVWVVANDSREAGTGAAELAQELTNLDWRLSGIVVMPVSSIEGAPDDL